MVVGGSREHCMQLSSAANTEFSGGLQQSVAHRYSTQSSLKSSRSADAAGSASVVAAAPLPCDGLLQLLTKTPAVPQSDVRPSSHARHSL
eukprot:6204130-Pleurochrysis_carterae.AAC.5